MPHFIGVTTVTASRLKRRNSNAPVRSGVNALAERKAATAAGRPASSPAETLTHISTRSTLIPHGSVASSRAACTILGETNYVRSVF